MNGYQFIHEDKIPVIVYDVSIEDMEERRKKAKTYASMKKAAQALGISDNGVKYCVSKRKRIFSPHLGREVAIRLKTKT
jgi:hypothetical protein